jgi:hypothetical protein
MHSERDIYAFVAGREEGKLAESGGHMVDIVGAALPCD